jgi:hypothetical protein
MTPEAPLHTGSFSIPESLVGVKSLLTASFEIDIPTLMAYESPNPPALGYW